jgi:hypothetical protein
LMKTTGTTCSQSEPTCTSMKASCMQLASSKPSAARATSETKGILLTTPALESSLHSSHTSDKRQASTVRIQPSQEASKSGDKVYTGSLRSDAQKDYQAKQDQQAATTSRLASLTTSTHRSQMSSITEEVHSSFLGITTTAPSQRYSLRVPTTVRCSFLRTLIWSIPMPIRSSHLPYGST